MPKLGGFAWRGAFFPGCFAHRYRVHRDWLQVFYEDRAATAFAADAVTGARWLTLVPGARPKRVKDKMIGTASFNFAAYVTAVVAFDFANDLHVNLRPRDSSYVATLHSIIRRFHRKLEGESLN